MKNVLIKYNPYKLETEITIDGKALKDNSKLREAIKPGRRLQEWVETLPEILLEEQGETKFDLTFHGILSDYEDVVEVFTKAYKELGFEVRLDRNPAKETSDKEKLIEDVFQRILRESPFEELKDKEIQDSFNKVKSSDFEVCVVATMSAGKSTLINAMLGTQLMPSKQEACTAIITKIKDVDNKYEKGKWRAKVYNKAGKLTKTHEEIDFSKMNALNEDENIARIEMEGDIPFVSAEDISLVLVDTPGPNNARNEEHKEIQSNFLDSSSKTLVLYIMEPTFGSDSDNELLQRVAESMKVGGKQSKDRFIFVLNKIDDRRSEDGEMKNTLDKANKYLKIHGIEEANLFPAAALPALNIRLILGGTEVDEDTIDETDIKVKKFNRKTNEMLHLEQYAPLPKSIKEKIQKDAKSAKKNENAYQEALIHTGIVSIEAAIRQYVQKYAKTAKIKNLVDTFQHKVESAHYFAELQKKITESVEKREEICKELSEIEKKIDSAEEGKRFKKAIDEAVNDTGEACRKNIDNIFEELRKKQKRKIDDLRAMEKIPLNELNETIEKLESFAKKLESDMQIEVKRSLRGSLCKTAESLLDQYRRKVAALTEELDLENFGIDIDPLELVNGNLGYIDVESAVRTEEEEDGKVWVKNEDKAWYKPWTWFQPKGYWHTTYKSVKYVILHELSQIFFKPITEGIQKNKISALEYEKEQSAKIANKFMEKFKCLDAILKDKLDSLKKCTDEKENIEESIHKIEHNLEWLKDIEKNIKEILEI